MSNDSQHKTTDKPLLYSSDAFLREAVATRLFGLMYGDFPDNDPEFPRRLWNSLPDDKRRLWYRQSDAVMEVVRNAGWKPVTFLFSTSSPPMCAGCGRHILPVSFRGETPTTHMRCDANGTYHIGCPHD